MPLTVDLKPGAKLQIGEATLLVEHKSGQIVRLVIDAPKSVAVKKLTESPSMRLIAEQGIMTA